jgi:hypothetical protein
MKKFLIIIPIVIVIVISIILLYPKEKPKEHKTIYTSNTYDESIQNNNKILIGQGVPKEIKQYKTSLEARNNFSNKSFYFKHEIEDGKVKESYVGFVITEEMANNNQGMTSGEYELKGYKSSYKNNKKTLLNSFGETNCKEELYNIHCRVNGFYANAFKNGYVDVGEGYWVCYVSDKGASRCDFGK